MNALRLATVAVAFAAVLLAADVTGVWKASFTSPDGQARENTFNLKADGDKLTGTLSSAMGESKVQDGQIKGDEVTFTVVRNFNGDDVTFKYKGKVEGNKMTLHVTAGDREIDMVATKQ
jgi:hypothetical protein